MKDTYYAHTNGDNKENWQKLKDHLENVAKIISNFSKNYCDQDYACNLGLLHDIGKYQKKFQDRLSNEKIKVEHAIFGAYECQFYNMCFGEYPIVAHHSGLPDFDKIESKVEEFEDPQSREAKAYEEIQIYKKEIQIKKIEKLPFLINAKDKLAISFFIRMMFSCLVDADYLDSEGADLRLSDSNEKNNFIEYQNKLELHLNKLNLNNEVNKKRKEFQDTIMKKANEQHDIYYMNMPTGSGKTLASMRFALQRAILGKKDRIIYVIPFESIIDQNAKVFREIFGENSILEYHSGFDFGEEDEGNKDSKLKQKLFNEENEDLKLKQKLFKAYENWDAPIIITTAVQFFESLYKTKPKKLRKIHNITNSIILFDEVHMLPVKYYKACLDAIKVLCKNFNCEAVFMTATMPDFDKWLIEFDVSNNDISTVYLLGDNKNTYYKEFDRCNYANLGQINIDDLIAKLILNDNALVVVNRKKTAKDIYDKLQKDNNGNKEIYHLSTNLTQYDREKIITKLKEDLQNDKKIIVVSTSLIEAGVDLDFSCIFREILGLDNFLQTAGRCNREGKKDKNKCTAYLFELKDQKRNEDEQEKIVSTKNILPKIIENNSIKNSIIHDYYNIFFSFAKKKITQNAFYTQTRNQEYIVCKGLPSYKNFKEIKYYGFNFDKYAKDFNFIENQLIDVIIPQTDEANKLIKELNDIYEIKGELDRNELFEISKKIKRIKRKLRKYTVSVKDYVYSVMREQGVVIFKNDLSILQNLFVQKENLNNNVLYLHGTGIITDVEKIKEINIVG